jgi:hypothetical protein
MQPCGSPRDHLLELGVTLASKSAVCPFGTICARKRCHKIPHQARYPDAPGTGTTCGCPPGSSEWPLLIACGSLWSSFGVSSACLGIPWGQIFCFLEDGRHLCEQMYQNHRKTHDDLAFWNLPAEPPEPPDSAEVVSASVFQTPPSTRAGCQDDGNCFFGLLMAPFGRPLGSLRLALGSPGPNLFFLEMDDIFASKCARIMKNTARSSFWEFARGAPGAPGFRGSGVSKCFSDPPFHMRRGSG